VDTFASHNDGAATPAEALAALRARLQTRGAMLIGWLRFGGAWAVVALSAVLGFGLHERDWRDTLLQYVLYALLATGLLGAIAAERARKIIAPIAPFLDVITVAWLQRSALATSPHPAGVAGWALGPFVLLVLFASLALRPTLIYPTAIAAWAAEAYLQRSADIGWGAVIASGLVLLLAAALLDFAARQVDRTYARLVNEQVARQLALARNEELAREKAATADARRELQEKHENLLAAQREAELLSSLLVHDFKGPLSSVLALVELAREDVARASGLEPQAEDLNVALGQGRRLLSMVHDLVSIARLEKGTLQTRLRPLGLRELFEPLVKAHAAEARRKGASLRLASLEPLTLPLDGELLQRAVENMLTNALTVVGAGDQIELGAERRAGELLLIVRNTGPRVPDEVRPRLFERSASTGKGRANAGLGLYFCRLVARAHGGEATLLDERGWSATFALRLPLAADASPPLQPTGS
jgi:signal transduction histidine kinase